MNVKKLSVYLLVALFLVSSVSILNFTPSAKAAESFTFNYADYAGWNAVPVALFTGSYSNGFHIQYDFSSIEVGSRTFFQISINGINDGSFGLQLYGNGGFTDYACYVSCSSDFAPSGASGTYNIFNGATDAGIKKVYDIFYENNTFSVFFDSVQIWSAEVANLNLTSITWRGGNGGQAGSGTFTISISDVVNIPLLTYLDINASDENLCVHSVDGLAFGPSNGLVFFQNASVLVNLTFSTQYPYFLSNWTVDGEETNFDTSTSIVMDTNHTINVNTQSYSCSMPYTETFDTTDNLVAYYSGYVDATVDLSTAWYHSSPYSAAIGISGSGYWFALKPNVIPEESSYVTFYMCTNYSVTDTYWGIEVIGDDVLGAFADLYFYYVDNVPVIDVDVYNNNSDLLLDETVPLTFTFVNNTAYLFEIHVVTGATGSLTVSIDNETVYSASDLDLSDYEGVTNVGFDSTGTVPMYFDDLSITTATPESSPTPTPTPSPSSGLPFGLVPTVAPSGFLAAVAEPEGYLTLAVVVGAVFAAFAVGVLLVIKKR